MIRFGILIGLLVLIGCSEAQYKGPADLVDPMIGTESTPALSNGNVYPSVTIPFGMTAWTPQTGEWGWIYTWQDTKFQGIRATHQPSPWMGDYGQFTIMAGTGNIVTDDQARAISFSHIDEESHPYGYSIDLITTKTRMEVSPTTRCGSIRLDFGAENNYFILDLSQAHASISVSKSHFSGYTTINSGGVPDNFKTYVYGKIEGDVDEFGVWHADSIMSATSISEKNVGAWFRRNKKGTLTLSIGTSFISVEQAKQNMEQEIGTSTFLEVKEEAKAEWNKQLSKIEVETITSDDKVKFYSNLFRVMTFPRIWYEINAEQDTVHYSAYDGKVHPGVMFADNGFWDTFRAEFPLLTLLFPDQTGQMIQGLTNAYKEGDWLPKWTSPGYRNVMIGTHVASLAADAWNKGIHNFDLPTLYEGVKKDILENPPPGGPGRIGNPWYLTHGYVPYDKVHEATARTLEYSYGDYCVSEVARILGNHKDRYYFLKLSENYRNVYDPEVGFMRGKDASGAWRPNFSAIEWGGPFTEGSSWHYSWSVKHDQQKLIDMMGGNEAFVQKLDDMFTTPPDFLVGSYGAEIHEMTEMVAGNMGQYAHGNQPVHHVLYLYQYARQPWKTEKWVRKVMSNLYGTGPDGYCGDEDNGQMSAWYVFSSLGFYPVTPGTGQYVLGSPSVKKATIYLNNGQTIEIDAENNSKQNIYVRNLKVNKQDFSKSYIDHSQLLKGATLEFEMSDQPNVNNTSLQLPYSLSNDSEINWDNLDPNHVPDIKPTVKPVVISEAPTHFRDAFSVKINSKTENAEIYYTLDGSDPDQNSARVSDNISITESAMLKLRAYKANHYKSPITSKEFIKVDHNYKVDLSEAPSKQYSAAGPISLVDRRFGSENYHDGRWMGWQGKDVEVLIDLEETRNVERVGISVMQNQGAWIFLPESVEILASADGTSFSSIGSFSPELQPNTNGTQLLHLTKNVNADFRYLKVTVKSYNELPEWHQGAGGKPFIFVDEIIIE